MAAKKIKNASIKVAKKVAQIDMSAYVQTERDFKDALLMVSIFANLFILCIWVALQTTSTYDQELIQFFINR